MGLAAQPLSNAAATTTIASIEKHLIARVLESFLMVPTPYMHE